MIDGMKQQTAGKYCVILLLTISYLFIAAPVTAQNVAAAVESQVIHKGYTLPINDDAITSAQIIAQLRESVGDKARNLSRNEFVQEYASLVQQLALKQVYEVLQYQYAKKELKKREIPEEAIERALNIKKKELIAEYEGSEARLRAKLAEEGYSLEERLERTKRQIYVEAFQQFHFMPTQTITRSDMLQYYRNHKKDEFYEPPQIRFQLIDIFKDENGGPTQARRIAEKALQEIKAGKDFADAAMEYSDGFRKKDGGMWPLYNPNALRDHYQPVVKAMENLDINEITAIVDGENRYFIGKLLEKRPERIVPFSQSQEKIKEMIRQQRWQTYSKELTEQLWEESTIGNMEMFMTNTLLSAYEELTTPVGRT